MRAIILHKVHQGFKISLGYHLAELFKRIAFFVFIVIITLPFEIRMRNDVKDKEGII